MNEADERTIEVYEVNQLIVNNTLCKQTMRRQRKPAKTWYRG